MVTHVRLFFVNCSGRAWRRESRRLYLTGLHRRWHGRIFRNPKPVVVVVVVPPTGRKSRARARTKPYSSRGSQKSRPPPRDCIHGAFMSHDSPRADSSDRSSSTGRFMRTQSSRTSARARIQRGFTDARAIERAVSLLPGPRKEESGDLTEIIPARADGARVRGPAEAQASLDRHLISRLN